jgi:hypothetical protein
MFFNTNNYSTLDIDHDWEGLSIQLRKQQTCTSINHNSIKGGLIFTPVFEGVPL